MIDAYSICMYVQYMYVEECVYMYVYLFRYILSLSYMSMWCTAREQTIIERAKLSERAKAYKVRKYTRTFYCHMHIQLKLGIRHAEKWYRNAVKLYRNAMKMLQKTQAKQDCKS